MKKVVVYLSIIAALITVFMYRPINAQAAVVNAGYYETSETLTKHVGQTYNPTTEIDGTATWTSSDSTIARVDEYSDTGACISFLKEGVATVTFTNTYTYIKPVFEQTGTTTGIWHAEACTGKTIIHFNITVKEALGTSLFAGGNGTAQSPFLISTKEQLQNMNNANVLHSWCYFKLTNNIAFTPEDFKPGGDFYNDGHGWLPIGFYIPKVYGQTFNGTFDGNGYVISGLQCNYGGTGDYGKGYFGLFGVNYYGTIKNLGVENSIFLCYSASDANDDKLEFVGGIAGDNSGTILNCYVKNCLLGGNSAGGIAGDLEYLITDCYSADNDFLLVGTDKQIEKGFTWGGLAGTLDSTSGNAIILDCYTADLSFTYPSHSGAVAGYLLPPPAYTLLHVYETYYNNTDTNAFYYRSGTTDVTKLTNSNMQKKSSFYGFDFTNTWTIDNTADYKYPTLKVFHPFQETLYISALPKKTVYMVGSKLDLAGGEVSYTNSEGNTESYSATDDIFNPASVSKTGFKGSISGVDMSTPGEKTVTVEYMGQTAKFTVYVVDSKLASILKISCSDIMAGSSPEPKVEQNDSGASVTYAYYSDPACTQPIQKPDAAGTYYVKASMPETDVYQAAASNAVQFSIIKTTPVGISYNKTDKTSYGAANGSIVITASGGNSGTYKYSIDGGANWQDSGSFEGLKAGTYTAAACDANNINNIAVAEVVIEQPMLAGNYPANKIPANVNVGTVIVINPPKPPKNSTVISVNYQSSNNSVAVVDSNGNVTFVGGGRVKITIIVTTQTVDKKGKVKNTTTKIVKTITVKQPVSSIELNMTNAQVNAKKKITLKAVITPPTASNKKLIWKSSNNKVAVVSAKGVVTGKAKGTAVITCIASDGSKVSASCTITVY